MGIVYRAEDTKLKRTVALKFLPPELIHIPDVKERFMREAQAAAVLDHPNICTVYEFDEAEEKTFISMAYIEGQSLRHKIESGPLELDDALEIATQAAEGLQTAHKKGVVHRDIKSANIMVTERGQAKIMDFGLARMTGRTLLTQEGTAMGTVAYMSPEQAQGEDVDHRTDIWSFGVVLYEMLGGQLPFKGENDQAVVYSILNQKPKPIIDINANIPASIEQVVNKALEKDPDRRYQQIDELLDDLKSISAGIVPEEIKSRLRKAKLLKRKRSILYAGVVGLVIIIALLALALFTGRTEAIESIAVLPLENLTGDMEKQYVVDSVMDELIGKLGQISRFRKVTSRTSAMKYKETDKSLSEIARELKVDAIVEGTVYQVGDSIRVRFQLTDALPEEQNLWGEIYERPMRDVFMMYNEVAKVIASELKIGLTQEEETRFADESHVNPEAYEIYLRGRYYLDETTEEGFTKSIELFKQAIEKDPNFAQAWAMLGLSYLWMGNYNIQPPREVFPSAKAAALKAKEIDDSIGETYLAMTGVRWSIERNFPAAASEIRRSLELNPNSALANDFYAQYLSMIGEHDDAIMHIKKAWELDPLSAREAFYVGRILYFAHRYDMAIEQCEYMLEINPNDENAHWLLGLIYIQKGMNEKAIEAFQKALELSGLRSYLLAYAYAVASRKIEAQKILDEFLELSKQMHVSNAGIAIIYLGLGEMDQAFKYLDKAYKAYDSWLFQLHDPLWDPLRSDPRFAALLEKMGLK
jgi:TolB-like protein/cytochrome c-type biogenesis protein CcmH/NrfG